MLGLPVGGVATWLCQGDDRVLLQKGAITDAASNGEYQIFYPRPIASPLNLKILRGGTSEAPDARDKTF